MLIQTTHCGEVVETHRTADETGLDVGQSFRLIGQRTLFVCCGKREHYSIPVAEGISLDRTRYTQARICDVISA